MIILVVLSVILNVSFGYALWNSSKKMDTYEEYASSLLQHVHNILDKMRSIDIRGAFEADDEVGEIFKRMLGLVETLEKYIPENDNND